jgi:predicted GNAT superfamily acetyltransferase
MHARLIDPHGPAWSAEIDRIGALLHAGQNPTLFPYHFLQVVLPRLGGRIAWLVQENAPIGVGFLFPRGLKETGSANGAVQPRYQRDYTLRYHSLGQPPSHDHIQQIVQAVQAELAGASVSYYDPTGPHHYSPSDEAVGALTIGRPSAGEAAHTRELHRRIWGSPPEFLYPSDIYSAEFCAGTGLVARVEGQLAAFLFGFYRFDGPPLPADWSLRFQGALRLESQVMGVLPDYRGMRIANLLKRVQAEHAWADGIGVVHWTADPLQFPNAALNFGLLRALAFHHYPDLYPFRNDLNRVPASRFGLTWLVGSARVRNIPLTGSRSLILDLAYQGDIQRVNDGLHEIGGAVDKPYIAIEIPADWTELQQRALDEALAWRAVSDRIFARYVGMKPGQYVITGVATEGDHRFLIGQRVDDALWEHLGHVGDDTRTEVENPD